jgi:hypothetical protein
MRLFYPGQTAIPLMLVLFSAVFMLTQFDIIQFAPYWRLWPVTLIAAGLEELYLWAFSGK